jgi:hypothetical protein
VLPVPFGEISSDQLAAIACLTKTRRWNYEEEYRLVRYPDFSFTELGLTYDGQHARFPANLLTGITVGLRMKDAEIRELAAMAARHQPPLPIFRPQPTK